MDATSVTLGKETRDMLRKYRDENEHRNYNQAIRSLLEDSGVSADV